MKVRPSIERGLDAVSIGGSCSHRLAPSTAIRRHPSILDFPFLPPSLSLLFSLDHRMLLRRLASISRLHGTLLHFHPARFALLQLPPLPSLTTPYSTLSTPMPRPTASYGLSQLPQQDWRIEDGKDGRSFAVLSKEVDKSPNDRDREYRFLTLGNGLRVLLISDKTTDKGTSTFASSSRCRPNLTSCTRSCCRAGSTSWSPLRP